MLTVVVVNVEFNISIYKINNMGMGNLEHLSWKNFEHFWKSSKTDVGKNLQFFGLNHSKFLIGHDLIFNFRGSENRRRLYQIQSLL